ncbi:MAG: SRPBCC family protein [Bacteroidetes bacterium]|nr:SRPBCC family protein [Bacteroidota bacterium]
MKITVKTKVLAPIEKAWQCWTTPEDIVKWNFASDEWHCPKAENDFRQHGKFVYRMEAKDGSFGFDFWGIYDNIENQKLIEITMGDNRKLSISFIADGDSTLVIENFEAEAINTEELQRTGWQAILDNFKKHVESK